jgi:hypothetical protein
MNQRVLIAVRIDPAVLKALQDIKVQDGIPVNEQIRRAIQLWLDQKQRPEKKSKK